MAIAGAAGNLISAGGGMIGSVFENEGNRKAINKQMDALGQLQILDPEKYKKMAYQGDVDAWRNRLKALREVDPQLNQIRNDALSAMTTRMAELVQQTGRSDKIGNMIMGLAQQFSAGAPAEMALGEAFMAKAKERLGRGAELPPTYQAELVRSGLEEAGAVGIGADRRGPVAGRLGKLLGRAATEQEILNEQQAAALAATGQALTANRMNILAGLVPTISNLDTARTNLGLQGLGVVEAEAPRKVGFAGTDIVGLEEQKRAETNQKLMEMAKLKGMQDLRQGRFVGGLIRTGSSAIGGALSSMAGGGLFGSGAQSVAGAGSGGIKGQERLYQTESMIADLLR